MLTIRTPRLLLRPFRESDAPGLAAHRSDPGIDRYVPWTAPYTVEAAIDLIHRTPWKPGMVAGESAMIAIELREGIAHDQPGPVIGDGCIQMFAKDSAQAGIGYSLALAHHGRGYATEAMHALINALFTGGRVTELPLHRLTAVCDVENHPSYRLLERLGMRREAHLIESIHFKGCWSSEYHYAILRREWRG